jgi:predicted branched-subunit amino acid permease
VLVIAGVAQSTALALLEAQAPMLIVIIAALAVNLRMAMYSAALLAFAVGIGLKSVLGAVFAGMFGLYLMQYLFA